MAGTDGQVYIRFLDNGDEEAFRFLYEKYREGLVRFLYGMVQNIEDAEELMMDTFAVLISGTAHYTVRKDAEFKTWLYAVARNQARIFLRRHREMPVAPENMDCEQLSPEPGPERTFSSSGRRTATEPGDRIQRPDWSLPWNRTTKSPSRTSRA